VDTTAKDKFRQLTNSSQYSSRQTNQPGFLGLEAALETKQLVYDAARQEMTLF